jgi:acid phosphatase
MRSRKIFVGLLITAVLLAGCATTQDAVRPGVAAPAPASAATDDNLNAVLWTQSAIEHDLVFEEIWRDARERLVEALADPDWNALATGERVSGAVHALPAAIIVDIDETVLDNSPYQARLVRDGESFDPVTWAEWCREARAEALPGAREFARFAADHDVTMYYISNRDHDLAAATLANLRAEGFPVADETVFLGRGAATPGCVPRGGDKTCRRQLVAQDHRILMLFGDQIGDFVAGFTNTPEGREAAITGYRDWFGERWFLLPNPTYGSWEPAVFGNDWSAPPDERRRAKRAALRTR